MKHLNDVAASGGASPQRFSAGLKRSAEFKGLPWLRPAHSNQGPHKVLTPKKMGDVWGYQYPAGFLFWSEMRKHIYVYINILDFDRSSFSMIDTDHATAVAPSNSMMFKVKPPKSSQCLAKSMKKSSTVMIEPRHWYWHRHKRTRNRSALRLQEHVMNSPRFDVRKLLRPAASRRPSAIDGNAWLKRSISAGQSRHYTAKLI